MLRNRPKVGISRVTITVKRRSLEHQPGASRFQLVRCFILGTSDERGFGAFNYTPALVRERPIAVGHDLGVDAI